MIYNNQYDYLIGSIPNRDDFSNHILYRIHMIVLQEHFEALLGRKYSPRELDSFLLRVNQILKDKNQLKTDSKS